MVDPFYGARQLAMQAPSLENRPKVTPVPEPEDEQPEEDNLLDDFSLKGDTGYGTDSLIKILRELPNRSSNNIFDTILINVMTIIRNNATLERDDREIKKYTMDDTLNLVNACAAYQEEMSHLLNGNPMVVFYLPDYSWVPDLHMRKPSPLKIKINKVLSEIITDDNLKVKKQIRSYQGKSTIYELYAGGKEMPPHKSIMRFINQINTLGVVDTNTQLSNYLLISHCPIDYHLLLNYRRMMILESFTGELIPPKRLGFKVFKNNFVPFNSVTHLLFGDPVQVKPMAQRKNRKLIMDMAAKQSWNVRTPPEIAKMVGDSGQVDSRILQLVKF